MDTISSIPLMAITVAAFDESENNDKMAPTRTSSGTKVIYGKIVSASVDGKYIATSIENPKGTFYKFEHIYRERIIIENDAPLIGETVKVSCGGFHLNTIKVEAINDTTISGKCVITGLRKQSLIDFVTIEPA